VVTGSRRGWRANIHETSSAQNGAVRHCYSERPVTISSAQFAFGSPPLASAAPATVLVAEPELLLAEALAALCVRNGRFQPLSVVTSGDQALTAVIRSTPDVAVASLDLPGLHTLELIGRVLSSGVRTRFVVLSGRTDRKTVLECLRAGAQGLVLR